MSGSPKEMINIGMTPIEKQSIKQVLYSMHTEQTEHLYFKFSEGYIKYRMVVADWMVDVAEYFSLHPTTTHAAVAYLDRIQPNEKFTRLEWQMLAISCLLISSKYNEMEEHVPSLRKLEQITQQTISNASILNYELWALKRMGWKLNARTPMAFLYTYMNLGVVFPTDKFNFLGMSSEDLEGLIEEQCTMFATKALLDVQFKPYQSSVVATAILFQVRKDCGIVPVWNDELTALTSHDPYTVKSVSSVLLLLQEYVSSSCDNSQLEPENTSQDHSFNESILTTLSLNESSAPTSPQPTRSNAAADHLLSVITPANKENCKPGCAELSPVSIANLDVVA